MDTPPHPSARKRIKLLVALALVVVIGVALYLLLAPSNPKIVWLTPEELAKSTQPGKLTVLRRKLMALTAPLWRWYHPHRPVVRIDSLCFEAPRATVISKLSLGTPLSTNAQGKLVWIISVNNEFNSLTNLISKVPPRLVGRFLQQTTVDGSSISLGGGYFPWEILVTPTISGQNVNLGIGSTMFSSRDNMVNFATRVVLTTGSAVLIDCGSGPNFPQNDFWLIISPTILDANGNPIKP